MSDSDSDSDSTTYSPRKLKTDRVEKPSPIVHFRSQLEPKWRYTFNDLCQLIFQLPRRPIPLYIFPADATPLLKQHARDFENAFLRGPSLKSVAFKMEFRVHADFAPLRMAVSDSCSRMSLETMTIRPGPHMRFTEDHLLVRNLKLLLVPGNISHVELYMDIAQNIDQLYRLELDGEFVGGLAEDSVLFFIQRPGDQENALSQHLQFCFILFQLMYLYGMELLSRPSLSRPQLAGQLMSALTQLLVLADPPLKVETVADYFSSPNKKRKKSNGALAV
jgi:hypothetical protein